MLNMFCSSIFNGDISNWDVSSLESAPGMFENSRFNQDISKWNLSSATNIRGMFTKAEFNQDISGWDVSKVEYMDYFFLGSKFKQDVSNWNQIDLKYVKEMFKDCSAPIPYWLDFDTSEEKNHNKMINMLLLKREIEINTVSNNNTKKRIKI